MMTAGHAAKMVPFDERENPLGPMHDPSQVFDQAADLHRKGGGSLPPLKACICNCSRHALIISPLTPNKSYCHKACGNTKSEVENATATYNSLAGVEIDLNVVMLKKNVVQRVDS